MKLLVIIVLVFNSGLALGQTTERSLDLNTAIKLAIHADPWFDSSFQRQSALEDEGVSSASLPDPRISLKANNFPVDSFDINQEPMTQIAIGISQKFPRGETLALSNRQKQELAAQEPMLRTNRTANALEAVTTTWLEIFKAQESIRLIEQDRELFEQLVDATRASYSSALGRARQQDVIRAQLELTRLEDRLTNLKQQKESAQERLSEWIGSKARQPVSQELPRLDAGVKTLNGYAEAGSEMRRYEYVSQHPKLKAFDQRITALRTSVELAGEKYKPEWSLSAQYGYRADDDLGRDRSDLFSVGVTFDLPIFTTNRQDRDVKAALSKRKALESEKELAVRQMAAALQSAAVRLKRLKQRQALYDEQLLPQMAEQSEASLTAYDNDDGDFAEAVRARIAELNAKIDALGIAVAQQKTIANINYLLSGTEKPAVQDAE